MNKTRPHVLIIPEKPFIQYLVQYP